MNMQITEKDIMKIKKKEIKRVDHWSMCEVRGNLKDSTDGWFIRKFGSKFHSLTVLQTSVYLLVHV